MGSLLNMIWIETRKAFRSKMPLWTTLGSLFLPLGIAFLIFVARNPAITQKLGLVSAKANLMAYSATDWKSYLVLFAELISAGGFFFFIISVSWVFGREFADGTLKDLLAVPVQRSNILIAKFIVVAAWCVGMAIIILVCGLLVGVIINLPGGSLDIQAGPQTLALPDASGRLVGADGRVYMWSIFTTDGKIRLASALRRIENVVPGAYVLQVEGGVSREVTVTEGGRSVVSLP